MIIPVKESSNNSMIRSAKIYKMESHKSNIKKVIVMTRHGQRSPLIISDTEKNWKSPPAFLTSKGAATMHSKGADLRGKLESFFQSQNFDKITMKVYSSNLNRTILSAYYFVRGIFSLPVETDPLVGESEALAYLNQYTLIRKPMKYDLLLRYFNTGTSKTMEENHFAQNEKYKEAKTGFEVVSKLLPLLPPQHKMTLENISYIRLFYFYDYLKMYLSHDLPLPHGFPMEIYNELEFTEKLLHELLYGNPISLRIANYPLALEITEMLTDSRSTFALLSGHDVNLSAFLRLFNYIPKSIPFGAHWMLICYEDGSIEITYHGDSSEKIYTASTEDFIKTLKNGTYQSDEEYLRDLRCGSTENILKAYRESSCEGVENEVTI